MTTYSYNKIGSEEAFYCSDFVGVFATPIDAAAYAFFDDPELKTVLVSKNETATAHDFVDGHIILHGIMEDAYDETEEASDTWLHRLLSDEAKCDELERLIGDWIQANEPPQFPIITEVTNITRAAFVAAGNLEKIRNCGLTQELRTAAK